MSEQTHPHAIFRYEFPSSTRSAFVSVDLAALPRSVGSHEEFAQIARQDTIQDRDRFEIVEYRQEPATIQGQWCIRFFSRTLDRRAANSNAPLDMVNEGWICRHPAFPNGVLTALFSERGLSTELDSSLHDDARSFLDGVVIEIAPGVPAG